MKIFKQILWILLFTLIGNLSSYLLGLIHVPFPGSLIGMILLFVFLLVKWIKIDSVKDVGQFFIDNMGIFFVPASIAILKQIELLSTIWWKLLIIIIAAFIVSFTATYYAVKLTLFFQNRNKPQPESTSNEGGNEA